jgi:hypothetical protein
VPGEQNPDTTPRRNNNKKISTVSWKIFCVITFLLLAVNSTNIMITATKVLFDGGVKIYQSIKRVHFYQETGNILN